MWSLPCINEVCKGARKSGRGFFQNKLSFSGDVKTSVTKRDKGVGGSKKSTNSVDSPLQNITSIKYGKCTSLNMLL